MQFASSVEMFYWKFQFGTEKSIFKNSLQWRPSTVITTAKKGLKFSPNNKELKSFRMIYLFASAALSKYSENTQYNKIFDGFSGKFKNATQ